MRILLVIKGLPTLANQMRIEQQLNDVGRGGVLIMSQTTREEVDALIP
jgi:hypothetical protein